jgi:hypothetical protein
MSPRHGASRAWSRDFGRELAPEHEKFCQLLAAGMDYKQAFDEAKLGIFNASDATRQSSASRLKKRFAWRVREIIGIAPAPKVLEATTEIVQGVLEDFRRDAPRARDKLWAIVEDEKSPASAKVRALTEILDRGLGKAIERREQNLNVRYVITSLTMSKEEWIAKYIKPADRIGTGNGSGTVN